MTVQATGEITKANYVRNTLLGFALLMLLRLIILPYFTESLLAALCADLGKLFFTTYLAYVTAEHFAMKAGREELRKLGDATGRRIFLQSAQLGELAAEVIAQEPGENQSAMHDETLASELNRLASHAELSFEEVQRMCGLDISIPELADEARYRVIDDTVQEKVACPLCSKEKVILLAGFPGASKHATCFNCHHQFIAHRMPDGSIKLRYQDQAVVDCPNPECGNKIRITLGPRDWGKAIRNCFECFARITYDMETEKVEHWTQEQPLTISESAIENMQAECPYCSWRVTFRESRNSKGQWVQYCPHCTKLILVEDNCVAHRGGSQYRDIRQASPPTY